MTLYTCKHCRASKPASAFYVRREARGDGRGADEIVRTWRCRECMRAVVEFNTAKDRMRREQRRERLAQVSA